MVELCHAGGGARCSCRGLGVPQPTAGNASLTDTGRSMWGGTRGPHPIHRRGVHGSAEAGGSRCKPGVWT